MTATAMEQLYQQVLLDHSKAPYGHGLVDPDATPELRVGESHQVNTTCGDEVTLRVEIVPGDAGDLVRRVSWEGQGCTISRASISVLTELVSEGTVENADRLAETFRELMHARGAGLDADAEDALGDATAFTGVAKFPARIKCALLGWAALRDAIIKAGAGTAARTEEDA